MTRHYLTDRHDHDLQPTGFSEILLVLLSCVLPPLGVLIRVGWHPHLLVSVLLTCLGWLPGVLHAVWVLGRYPHRVRSYV